MMVDDNMKEIEDLEIQEAINKSKLDRGMF